MIITDLAVFEVGEGGLILKEHAPDVTLDEIASKTAGAYTVSPDLRVISV